MKLIKGVVPAILTPFDSNDNVYQKGVYDQIDYLADNNIESLFIGGSYGSFALMSVPERKQLIKWSLDKTSEYGMNSIIQIGATTTKETIELAKFAEDSGADIVASVVPYYYSGSILTEGDILKHFEVLCNSVNIPVHCYNNPRTTGFNISPDFFNNLISVGLSGIKDGSGDVERLTKMLDVAKKTNVNYIAGSTSLMFVSVISGADGCVLGVALVAPSLLTDFYKACSEKRVDDAMVLQDKVLKVRNILQYSGPRAITCYDILHEKGIDVGTCRLPWRRLDGKVSNEIIKKMKEADIL